MNGWILSFLFGRVKVKTESLLPSLTLHTPPGCGYWPICQFPSTFVFFSFQKMSLFLFFLENRNAFMVVTVALQLCDDSALDFLLYTFLHFLL